MKIMFLVLMSFLYCACASVHAVEGKRSPNSYEGYYTAAEELTAESSSSLADAIVKARVKCDAMVTDNMHYNYHDIVLTSSFKGKHTVTMICMIIAK